MEKLKLRTIGGVAKVAGIMLCMGGVATLAFYKGPYLKPFLHNYHPFDSNNNSSQQGHDNSPGENWIKGCFLMFLSNLCWALWIVYQASMDGGNRSKRTRITNIFCKNSQINIPQEVEVSILFSPIRIAKEASLLALKDLRENCKTELEMVNGMPLQDSLLISCSMVRVCWTV